MSLIGEQYGKLAPTKGINRGEVPAQGKSQLDDQSVNETEFLY